MLLAKETFLEGSETREQPSVGKNKGYQQKETILALIEEETGKGLEAMRVEKGDLRRLTLDLLYRHGGIRGPEIGALFGVDYSAVSQERKRLRTRVSKDRVLAEMMQRPEGKLSKVKI